MAAPVQGAGEPAASGATKKAGRAKPIYEGTEQLHRLAKGTTRNALAAQIDYGGRGKIDVEVVVNADGSVTATINKANSNWDIGFHENAMSEEDLYAYVERRIEMYVNFQPLSEGKGAGDKTHVILVIA